MRKKKITQKKHVIGWTKQCFAFMDEHPKKPQVKRVNALLELLVAIQAEIHKAQRVGMRKPEYLGSPAWSQNAERIDRLRKIFRRYRWTQEILWGTRGDKQSEMPRPFKIVTAARKVKREHRSDNDWNRRDDDDWEYGAVGNLLFIAEHYPDFLSKIQRCTICPTWMLATKPKHRFCSGKCRQFEYDHDPERQERHRANMRRLYRMEKERDRKLKERAKIPRR